MSDSSNSSVSTDTMSFEDALTKLETIVRNLEQGNVPLEKSIDLYTQGEALRSRCDTLLRAAEEKIETIKIDGKGQAIASSPLAPE
ncbi:exodeoxyribonuclease VII small subunit [Flexibacterium corallicola]|uniref:exodeoxyribonuclease VII small subunit n=1 Tax=Flexibacterium corallicola TaxID=3037259 RepID=UPI00286F89D0|nr:exodeoxyribonuclease VII small subunit [Pseudovibrio sp. M1P-2-3]